MKQKPILFSAPMVRAILDGRKTQTRRVLKPQPVWQEAGDGLPAGWWWEHNSAAKLNSKFTGFYGTGMSDAELKELLLPTLPYAVGDLLWVRERFNVYCFMGFDCTITYEADKKFWLTGPNEGTVPDKDLAAYFRMIDKLKGKHGGRNFPSIHMPRWASRITLEVTAVKIERLQDISEDDAKAEGIFQTEAGAWSAIEGYAPLAGQSPKGGFYCLWNSINGPGSWDANPWVACYSFRRIAP